MIQNKKPTRREAFYTLNSNCGLGLQMRYDIRPDRKKCKPERQKSLTCDDIRYLVYGCLFCVIMLEVWH